MSNLLCSTSCGDLGDPPSSYWAVCDGNNFRKFGFPYYALVRCDVNLTDPTDLTQWQAAITAGTIQVSPVGKIDVPTPAFETSDDVSICGGTTVMTNTYTLTFSTYQTKTDLSDAYYFQDLVDGHLNYYLIWFDCAGNVYLSREYVDFIRGEVVTAPVGNPGYAFTISASPHPVEGDGKKMNWTIGMQIELDGDELILPAQVPGLLAALQA